jgi:hypothetical protein
MSTEPTVHTVVPPCLTVQEIAANLKLSEETVRNLFQDRPGVLKITKGKRLRGKREYVTLRIPVSVWENFLREAAA